MAIRNDRDPNFTPSQGTVSPTATAPGAKPLDASKLPRTGEAARALPAGARFEVWGQDAGGGAKLDVRKLDATRIEVALDGSKAGDKKTYQLDLSNPQAQRAYEDLTRFRSTKAEMMSTEPKKTGVVPGGAKNVVANPAAPAPVSPVAAQTAALQNAAQAVKVTGGVKTASATNEETGTKEQVRTATGGLTGGKGPLNVSANVTGQQKIVTTADGAKTETRSLGGNANAGLSTTQGETTLKGGATVQGSYATTTSKDADGNKTGTIVDKNASVTVNAGIEDKQGPNQFSVGGSHTVLVGQKTETTAAGKTVTNTTGTRDNAAVTGQLQRGEVVAGAGASYEQSSIHAQVKTAGGTTNIQTDTQKYSLDGSLKDTTGPTQGSLTVKQQGSETTKVTVDPKGQTTTQVTNTAQTNAALTGQHTTGQATITGGVSGEQKSTNIHTVGPNGATNVNIQSSALNGNLGVSDTTGATQYAAQVAGGKTQQTTVTTGPTGTTVKQENGSTVAASGSLQHTSGATGIQVGAGYENAKNTVSTTTATGTLTDTDETGKANVGVGVTRGETKVGVDLVRQWQNVSGRDQNGLRTQSGTLTTELDLTSSFKGDRKVGFERNSAKEYQFSLPATSTGTPALPTTSGTALALPEGATFALKSTGRMAINGEADGFKAGISQDRSIAIKVERGQGSVVTATVDFTGKNANSQGFDKVFGKEGGVQVTVGASRNQAKIDTRVDQFRFDLAQPAHQQAYDALLRGNMAPAQALATATTIDSTRSTELKAKLGVAYDKLGASVELSRRDIDPKDPAIQNDPIRKAATEALQQQGKDVRWIEKGGAFEIGGGHAGSISAGPIGVSYGFEGKKALEWRSIGPRADGEGGAQGLATTVEGAQAMVTGAEFQIRGTASVSGKAGVMAGWQAGVPGVTVGASVGFEAQRGKQVEMNVEVKKLDPLTVQVRMEELDTTLAGREFAAKLGVEVSGAELAASGGSLIAALANKPDLAAKLANIKKALSAEFAIGSSKTKQEGTGLTFTLDLSKPEARAVYQQLVKGNPDAALDLAANPASSGVTLKSSAVGTSVTQEKHINANIAGVNIHSSSEVRKDSTVTAVTGTRTEQLDASIAEKKQNSIWGRDRAVDVQAVSVRTPEAPTGTKYYRIGFQEKDRFTSEEELQSRRALAASLGAVEAFPMVVDKSRVQGRGVIGWLAGAKNDYGKLQTDIEVFITDKGIAALRASGRDKAITAYGAVYAEKNGGKTPNWADGHQGPWARNILDTYRNAKDTATRDAYRKAYEDHFGVEVFKQDVKDYARAADFAVAIEQGANDADPAAWNKAFADNAKRAGFNFFDGLAAMNKMAGNDQVLVNKFTVKGSAVNLEMVSEGSIAAPQLSNGIAATTSVDDARKNGR